jgi:hypothetical protein
MVCIKTSALYTARSGGFAWVYPEKRENISPKKKGRGNLTAKNTKGHENRSDP